MNSNDYKNLEAMARRIVESILISIDLEAAGAKVVATTISPKSTEIDVEIVKPVELNNIEIRLKCCEDQS